MWVPVMSAEIQNMLAKALTLHQANRLKEAERLYQVILKENPAHPEALNLNGILAIQSGRPEQAVRHLNRAITATPDNPQFHYNLATAHKNLGKVQLALGGFRRAVALRPNYVEAHNNLANLLHAADDLDAALAHYDAALAHKPDFLDALRNRPGVLLKLDRFHDALDDLDRALELAPHIADLHSDRCVVLQKLQRNDAAIASIETALKLAPKAAKIHLNHGNVLAAVNRTKEALASYQKALLLDPENMSVRTQNAGLLLRLGRVDDALVAVTAALELNPQFPEALSLRGDILVRMGDFSKAYADFDKGAALNPDLHFVHGKRMHAKMQLGDWSNLAQELADLGAALTLSGTAATPFSILSLLDDPHQHLAAARAVSQTYYPARADLGSHAARRGGEKIRLGYFSADFRAHPMGQLLAELFEVHDRDNFEVFAFAFGPDAKDDMRRRLEAGFDKFIDIRQLSDRDVAALSRDMGVDIAIDLVAHTGHSRLGMFAYGCAPIQVNYLGFPGTTGADYIDYVIGDDSVIPPENYQHFTEKVVVMPQCYQVNDSKRKIAEQLPTRGENGLPDDGFVFCCFNNSYKIMPATFDIWMRILGSVNDSVLWLFASNEKANANLRNQADIRGIDPQRLIFAPKMPLDKHLARHQLADLFLDTLPYNAHTTASDALWAGLPVLTRIGASFPARVAASLLQALDLPELVTETAETYEQRAIELAHAPHQLAALKSKLHDNRQTSALFKGAEFARNLEKAYVEMRARYQRGEAPSTLRVMP